MLQFVMQVPLERLRGGDRRTTVASRWDRADAKDFR